MCFLLCLVLIGHIYVFLYFPTGTSQINNTVHFSTFIKKNHINWIPQLCGIQFLYPGGICYHTSAAFHDKDFCFHVEMIELSLLYLYDDV